ncbi:MAG: elongation factor G [Hyphomicrobiales bacterium]
MKVYQTQDIRNIALVGGGKSGKTTLAEAMAYEGKVISRRGTIDDKNTLSDYREIEQDRENSVVSSLLYSEFDGKKINIIDTPGFADFVGEVVSALHVVNTVGMVVNAQGGVDVGTELAWRNAEKLNKGVFFVLNQMDHEKANFDEAIRSLKEEFGSKVTVTQYPVNTGEDFDSIVDLIEMKLLKFPKGGGVAEITEIPADQKDKAEELQLALIENAAEGSEELMEAFFETDTLTPDQVREGIRLGLTNRAIFPLLCTSAKECVAVTRLLEFINKNVPSPDMMPDVKTTDGKEVKVDSNGPAGLFVWKAAIEQHLGEVTFFKVMSGKITEGMDLENSRTGNKERITQINITAGKNRQKVSEVVAGDIASTIKLKDTVTNDSLLDPKAPFGGFNKIVYPDPIFTIAIKPKASSDEEKMGGILKEMVKYDPSLHITSSRELRQNILEGMGEFHINTVKWYFDNVYKIEIEFLKPKIAYRETITKSARANYRHKKQSGGSGQFGEVYMHIQPYHEGMADPTDFPVRGKEEHELPWGGKLIFHNCIVGGAIDARFMPAILKGIMERIEIGPLTGSYARDIAVYVYDGKMHPVDSNEISFKLAGRHSFIDAFKNAGAKILEPICNFEVRVPEDMMGSVMTDLQNRRSIIMGMEGDGKMQIIKAKVPQAELYKYSTSLSSMTSGRGLFSYKFDEYAPVPSDVQDQLLKEYEEQQAEEEN